MKVSPGEHLQICLRMTELISALGLRHVGYGIPTELVGPFANCFVEVLRENAPGEDAALEGFEWSIKLVAKILIRVIQEGSTIVMKVGTSDLYTTYSWKYGDGTGITRYNGIAVKPMVQHIWGDEPPWIPEFLEMRKFGCETTYCLGGLVWLLGKLLKGVLEIWHQQLPIAPDNQRCSMILL